MVTRTLPRISKAAVITKFGEPLEIRELAVPELPARALLVKIEAATVCGTDVHLWDGSLGAAQPIDLPVIPGHELVGRVVAFGADAEYDTLQRLEALKEHLSTRCCLPQCSCLVLWTIASKRSTCSPLV